MSVVVVRSFGLRPSPYLCRGAGRTFADIHVDGDFGGVVQVGHCVRWWEARRTPVLWPALLSLQRHENAYLAQSYSVECGKDEAQAGGVAGGAMNSLHCTHTNARRRCATIMRYRRDREIRCGVNIRYGSRNICCARFAEDRNVSWPHHPMAYVGASYVFIYIYIHIYIDVVTREQGRLK